MVALKRSRRNLSIAVSLDVCTVSVVKKIGLEIHLPASEGGCCFACDTVRLVLQTGKREVERYASSVLDD